jgi:hypothetical protein
MKNPAWMAGFFITFIFIIICRLFRSGTGSRCGEMLSFFAPS